MKQQKSDPSYVEEQDPTTAPGGYLKASEMEVVIAKGSIKDAAQRPAQLLTLAEETRNARKALIEAMEGIGAAVDNFKPKSDDYIRELRAFSVSGCMELRNLMRAFEDVRKFFLSDSHTVEMARLKEFVELCERLQALQKSGFLDKVVDTIIKTA